VFVLPCVQVGPLRQAELLSKESYRLCKEIKKLKSGKCQKRAVEPEIDSEGLLLAVKNGVTKWIWF
jgi:hypothetical protein